MEMLLLSNSTMPGEPYFEWAKSYVIDFLGETNDELVFIPFAVVSISYDEYFNSVSQVFNSLGYKKIISLHQSNNLFKTIENASVIMVGGGNTFHLLSKLYEHQLLEAIQNKIKSGAKYIGWSAGSNITGPTIKTTNDMPIVEPKSFNALNLVPFQINPHYTEATIPNHGGESRKDRLNEFLQVNKEIIVVGLPEGTLLEIANDKVFLKGFGKAKIFNYWREIKEVSSSDNLDWLLKL